jgi:hypothetical protein
MFCGTMPFAPYTVSARLCAALGAPASAPQPATFDQLPLPELAGVQSAFAMELASDGAAAVNAAMASAIDVARTPAALPSDTLRDCSNEFSRAALLAQAASFQINLQFLFILVS